MGRNISTHVRRLGRAWYVAAAAGTATLVIWSHMVSGLPGTRRAIGWYTAGVTFWSLRDVTSCRKSATPLRSGHTNPCCSKNSTTFSRGPWYTMYPARQASMIDGSQPQLSTGRTAVGSGLLASETLRGFRARPASQVVEPGGIKWACPCLKA